MPRQKAGDDAEPKRRALTNYIAENNLKPTTWAKEAGLTANTVNNFLNGHSDSLSERTYDALAAHETKRRGVLVMPAALRGQQAVEFSHGSRNTDEALGGTPIDLLRPRGHTAVTKGSIGFLGTMLGGRGDFRMRVAEAAATVASSGAAGNLEIRAFYIQSNVMSPRYAFGEAVLVGGTRKPVIGDHVLVLLQRQSGEDVTDCYVRKFTDMRGSKLVLTQYNPPAETEVDTADIEQILRVLTIADVLGIE